MKEHVRIYDFDYSLGDSYKCPSCGQRSSCRAHRYAYRKWYRNYRARMIDLASRHPELFPAGQWEDPDS